MNLFQYENNILESTFVELKNPRDALVFRKIAIFGNSKKLYFEKKTCKKKPIKMVKVSKWKVGHFIHTMRNENSQKSTNPKFELW